MNHLSYKSGRPLKSKVLYSSIQKIQSGWPILNIFCWHQHFLCKKWENDVTWRHVTSSCRIFTKISENVSLVDIMLWYKYEVICIILTEVMRNWVFSAFNMKYIRIYRKILTTPNKKPISSLLYMKITPKFHRMCKIAYN